MPGDSSIEEEAANAQDLATTPAEASTTEDEKAKEPHPIVDRLQAVLAASPLTLHDVGQQLRPKRSAASLSKALRGQHRLDPIYYHQILDIVGEPRELFWKHYYESMADLPHLGLNDLDPAHLLGLIAAESSAVPPEAIAKLLEAGLPALEEDPLEAFPARLGELDEVRMVDPEAAQERCLEWIEESRGRLSEGPIGPKTLADLLVALVFFATCLRGQGEVRLAARILAACFEAVEEADPGLVLSWLFVRSAAILTDSGYPKTALAFVERARGILATFDLPHEEIGVAICQGSHHYYLGQFGASRRCFMQALKHEAADENFRTAALSNLANLFERSGQPELAVELIEELEAGPLANATGRFATCAQWVKACASADLGHLELAAEELSSLGKEVARFCPPADSILLFCDYASVLVRLGDERRLQAAAEVALKQLPKLKLEGPLSKLASQLLERSATEALLLSEVKRYRRRLARMAKN